MIKLSKNILYGGCLFLILSFIFAHLWNLYAPQFIQDSMILAIGDSVINLLTFLVNTILIVEILRQIKDDSSFIIWYVILCLACVVSIIFSVLIKLGLLDIDISLYPYIFAVIGAFQGIPQIIILVKFFRLKGALSILFKCFGAFLLISILSTMIVLVITANFKYNAEDIHLISKRMRTTIELIRLFLVCGIFYESVKYLDRKSENKDSDDILDEVRDV